MDVANVTIDTNNTHNGNGVIDENYYVPSLKTKIIILVFFGLVIAIGVVGNLIVLLLIALDKSMHTTVNRCLFVLAVADMLILVFLLIRIIGYEFSYNHALVGKGLCYFLIFYDRGGVICSILIFCFLSIDRYVAICHPLKAHRLWSERNKHTYIILTIIWIITIALSVPYIYMTDYREGNATYYRCEFDFQETWKYVYDTVIAGVLIFVPIPMLFVFLYGRMIYDITQKAPGDTTGEGSTSGRRGRLQAMVMLISIVIIFLVCQIPSAALILLDFTSPHIFSYDDTIQAQCLAQWICRILVYINSAVNPIVYFSVSTKFRKAFRTVFCYGRKNNLKETTEPRTVSSRL